MKLDLSFWTNASSKRKRIYLIMFVFVVAFLLVAIGASIPISHQTANQLYDQENQSVAQNKGALPQYIFLHNFGVCLALFIPGFGPLLGVVSFVTTGYIIGAESQVLGISPLLYVAAEVFNPIFWLEFTAYSIGIAESIWLLRRLMQKRYWELKNTAILIGICAAFLVVGAIIESMLPLI
jgi:hypothetical protein